MKLPVDLLENILEAAYIQASGHVCSFLEFLSMNQVNAVREEVTHFSIGSLQKKYSIGAFELLSKMAPIQALLLLVLGPFIDYYLSGRVISDYMKTISSGATIFILISCSLAVSATSASISALGGFQRFHFKFWVT